MRCTTRRSEGDEVTTDLLTVVAELAGRAPNDDPARTTEPPLSRQVAAGR
jgi:hypothetical protein